MRYAILLGMMMLFTGCGGLSASGGVPRGAVVWCGTYEYTGTTVKAHTEGTALGVSDAELASRMSVENVIELATAMNCGGRG